MTLNPPLRTTPITAEDHPPGCDLLTLTAAEAETWPVVGRIVGPVTSGQAVGHGEGVAGCDLVPRLVRYPTTGLTLPGAESPVGVLVWCSIHGEVGNGMDTVTDEERAWGWHTPSQL